MKATRRSSAPPLESSVQTTVPTLIWQHALSLGLLLTRQLPHLLSRSHWARRFPCDTTSDTSREVMLEPMWAHQGSQSGLSQRKIIEPQGALYYREMPRWWSGHSHLGEVLLLGTSGSHSYLTSAFSFCSGWLAALATLKNGPLPVTIIMMVVAGFFTLCAGLSLFLLQRVHAFYRRTGASFQQAQEEFSQGIFSNRTFRSAASSAARGAFQGN